MNDNLFYLNLKQPDSNLTKSEILLDAAYNRNILNFLEKKLSINDYNTVAALVHEFKKEIEKRAFKEGSQYVLDNLETDFIPVVNEQIQFIMGELRNEII